MSRERQGVICCCGADVWLKVFAALKYIYSIAILVLSIQVLNGLAAVIRYQEIIQASARIRDDDSYEADTDFQDLNNFVLATLVIEFILNLAMASVLLFGTLKNNVKALWTGLILQALYIVFGFIILVVLLLTRSGQDPNIGVDIARTVVHILIGGFILYVIHCRIREVKDDRENPEERTAVYNS